MRQLWLFLSVLSILVVAAGCGDDDETSSSSSDAVGSESDSGCERSGSTADPIPKLDDTASTSMRVT